MFHHHLFIHAEHHVALESCIRNHMTVTARMLSDMYKMALANLDEPRHVAGMQTSHLKAGNVTVGTATDVKTGFFVQLANIDGQPRPLLTVGSKWAMEQPNPVQGNVATQLW